MNKKSLVYVAIGILGVLTAVVALLPGTGYMKIIVPENAQIPGGLKAVTTQIIPIVVKLNDTSVESATDKEVIIDTKFDVSNPNNTTVLLEMIGYDIYANSVFIGHGQIGEQLYGSYTSSNYFTLVQNSDGIYDSKATIENTGNNPQLWSLLQKGTFKWNIEGTAYFNTNTAFSGHSDSVNFNFTK